MHVNVKLFATFQKGRFERSTLECEPGTALGTLVDGLGIPRDEIGVLLVGGRHVELSYAAAAGDTISIFPLLGGG
ncbi:MAG TPA: MoaD/ThiS family protein [Anaeromyxobacteraceae bacterium]